MRHTSSRDASKEGSALIVTLWVLIILSLLVGSFAFDMYIESGITSYYRKRLKAQYLARAGVEYAKNMLEQSFKADAKETPPSGGEDAWVRSVNLSRGMGVSVDQSLGDGRFLLEVKPEPSRRNVNTLNDCAWEEVLDQGGVPQDMWPELIDCFHDWTDEGDEHQLNGAESDDSFYEQRGYECKNGPLDTVDVLLLIKGFTPEVVYGGTTKDGETFSGIASLLTTWGDGKVNVNAAPREVLLTLCCENEAGYPLAILDSEVDDILAGRAGTDETSGTKDDGWDSVDEVVSSVGLDPCFSGQMTVEGGIYRIVARGEVQGVSSEISVVLEANADDLKVLYWLEGDVR